MQPHHDTDPRLGHYAGAEKRARDAWARFDNARGALLTDGQIAQLKVKAEQAERDAHWARWLARSGLV